jgi:hypothetical protein
MPRKGRSAARHSTEDDFEQSTARWMNMGLSIAAVSMTYKAQLRYSATSFTNLSNYINAVHEEAVGCGSKFAEGGGESRKPLASFAHLTEPHNASRVCTQTDTLCMLCLCMPELIAGQD